MIPYLPYTLTHRTQSIDTHVRVHRCMNTIMLIEISHEVGFISHALNQLDFKSKGDHVMWCDFHKNYTFWSLCAFVRWCEFFGAKLLHTNTKANTSFSTHAKHTADTSMPIATMRKKNTLQTDVF